MKRTLLISILAVCMALFSSAAMAGKSITFTLGHFEPPDVQNTIEHPMAVVFKSVVEARTNGQIKVEIHPSNTLGKERQMLESTQMGVIQGCIIAEGTVPVFYPMVQVVQCSLYLCALKAWGGP